MYVYIYIYVNIHYYDITTISLLYYYYVNCLEAPLRVAGALLPAHTKTNARFVAISIVNILLSSLLLLLSSLLS